MITRLDSNPFGGPETYQYSIQGLVLSLPICWQRYVITDFLSPGITVPEIPGKNFLTSVCLGFKPSKSFLRLLESWKGQNIYAPAFGGEGFEAGSFQPDALNVMWHQIKHDTDNKGKATPVALLSYALKRLGQYAYLHPGYILWFLAFLQKVNLNQPQPSYFHRLLVDRETEKKFVFLCPPRPPTLEELGKDELLRPVEDMIAVIMTVRLVNNGNNPAFFKCDLDLTRKADQPLLVDSTYIVISHPFSLQKTS